MHTRWVANEGARAVVDRVTRRAGLIRLASPPLECSETTIDVWVRGLQRTWEAERALFQAFFDEERLLLTPGKDCHFERPGNFRMVRIGGVWWRGHIGLADFRHTTIRYVIAVVLPACHVCVPFPACSPMRDLCGLRRNCFGFEVDELVWMRYV
jgi:hypothetical protein